MDNGLRVILHRDNRVPIVAINLWYHVGSKNEVPGKTGYAHLFEHMMFQGSAHVGADMFFRHIQSIGGTLNGSTFFDRTNYFETLPSHYLELGLWLEADRMAYLLPALTQEKLANQIDVVKNERRQHVDNQPYGRWLETILEMIYEPDFPYHWPVIGYMDDLDRARMEDIRAFFETYYAPNNASLVIAGDIEPQQTRELVKRYFADIKPYPHIPPVETELNRRYLQSQRRVLQDHIQLPRIYQACHAPAVGAPDSYAAEILCDILSEGKSSRFYKSLVYDKQIAQDASAFILPMELGSLLFFVTTAKPGVEVARLEEEVNRQIDTLRSGGISRDELQRIKNQVEARKVREIQSVTTRADHLNMYATYFSDPGLINSEIEHYRAVTLQDVRELSARYLSLNDRATLIFEPENKKTR